MGASAVLPWPPLSPAPPSDEGLWKLKGHGVERVCRLRYMECSETGRDLLRYWARGHVRGNRRGREGADDAVGVRGGGPGGLTYKAEAAGTGHCGCWLEMVHQGS